MEKHQFDRNTHRLIERGVAALAKVGKELERLNDNIEDDDVDVQEDA